MKSTENQASRPIYLQLYRKMREEIVLGNYPFGTKLPSKRSLAEATGTSTVTVEHAYSLLAEEGYVEARERSGFIVIFRKGDGFAAAVERRPELCAAEKPPTNETFPLSTLSKTVRKILAEHGERLLEKSPNSGCLALREALCRYLARNRGIHVAPEQIVVGAGSEYLYGLIVKLLGRERIYAIESPSYKKIEEVYRANGVVCDPLPLTVTGIDSHALSRTRATVLHTTPYRSFPSGVTATASKRHEYVRRAEKQAGYIIEDDFESEFSILSKPTEPLFALSAQGRVIYLNTFSKTISPSLRTGYMVLPHRLAEEFRKTLGFYSCAAPTFSQYVLAELLDNGDFERHINRVRRKLRKELAAHK